jgi:hypothetical protein
MSVASRINFAPTNSSAHMMHETNAFVYSSSATTNFRPFDAAFANSFEMGAL